MLTLGWNGSPISRDHLTLVCFGIYVAYQSQLVYGGYSEPYALFLQAFSLVGAQTIGIPVS